MKAVTGARPPVDGVETFRVRQSSAVGMIAAISCGSGSCGHAGPNADASRTVVHSGTGRGAR
jgi:hypothetical protein